MITIKIDGKLVEAYDNESILKVAIREGIDIPHLCYHEAFEEEPYGACRLCIVEVSKDGNSIITTSCTLKAQEGLEIFTDTPRIRKHRKVLLELYLAEAPFSGKIKKLAEKYGVEKTRFIKSVDPQDPLKGKCILCGLCVRTCEKIGIGAINYIGRGSSTKINTPFYEENPDCLGCMACANICPTDAIVVEDIEEERIMKSWSETKIALKKCKICGGSFTPEPVWGRVKNALSFRPNEEIEELCPNCRRKYQAKNLIKNLPLR